MRQKLQTRLLQPLRANSTATTRGDIFIKFIKDVSPQRAVPWEACGAGCGLNSAGSLELQHRQEVSKHREWLYGAMESVARKREASVYSVASEGAKLDP